MTDNGNASVSQLIQTTTGESRVESPMSGLNINRNMSDSQLKQALSKLASAASAVSADPYSTSEKCSAFSIFCIWSTC